MSIYIAVVVLMYDWGVLQIKGCCVRNHTRVHKEGTQAQSTRNRNGNLTHDQL